MNRKLTIFLLIFLAIGLFSSGELIFAKEKDTKDRQPVLSKTISANAITTNRTLVNIGQVAHWIYADAKSANDPSTDPGMYFPRGSNPTTACIYRDGLVWGGLVNDGGDPIMRVGGMAYRQGVVAGAITSKGVREDTDDDINVNRIWRVRRDFVTASNDELRQDTAEWHEIRSDEVTETQIDQIREIYRNDWMDWPTWKGAPFYDADGDGQYNPRFYTAGEVSTPDSVGLPVLYPDGDEPGYANGDQVVWLVTNDLSDGATLGFAGAPPVGLELQITLWAYKRADALGNIVFKQFRFIYKGTASTPPSATIDSMYVCQWSDPDLGTYTDDFVGCDTLLSMSFCWNSSTNDGIYNSAGFPPAASGYDFFAGPIVDSPGDIAVKGLHYVSDKKNLPMTTFSFFGGGTVDGDPSQGIYDASQQWWNMLRGYRPRPIAPPERIKDGAGNVVSFKVPGDPVTGNGWIDGQVDSPGDRRMFMASGPFTMTLGDTNEVVVATLAGMGSDRLSSVAVLKFYDRTAQDAFDNLFELPSAPPLPIVKATEMDAEVMLDWGSTQSAVDAIEKFDSKGFVFEGYNVYQLPNAGATANQGILLANYDASNEVTVITQEVFDVNSGLILNLPVHQGTNSGLTRTYTTNYDRLREQPMYNGKTYYFGIEAYTYNTTPDAPLKTLSSPLAIVTVVPQMLKPGVRLNADFGQQIGYPDSTVTHVGISDGSVKVFVTNPTEVTGHEYEITFSENPDLGPVWQLTDVTTGDIKLSNQTNQSGDENYLNVDGIQVIVEGAPSTVKNFLVTSNANGALDPPEMGCFAFNNNGFPFYMGSDRPSSAQQVGAGKWGIHTWPNGDRAAFSAFMPRTFQYTGGFGAPGGNGIQWLIPRDFEIRFTATGGKAYDAWVTGGILDVPFELWDIGNAGDPNDDFQLVPYLYDALDQNGVFGLLDSSDHEVSGGANDPWTDPIYWINPTNNTPGSEGYNKMIAALETDPSGAAAWYAAPGDASGDYDGWTSFERMVLVNWNGGTGAPYNQDLPEVGTTFRIVTTKPNLADDKFTFSTAGYEPGVSADLAKSDVEKVNVFPNPYYGYNQSELDEYLRFVTFTHLPQVAKIRIFSVSGSLIRTIEKDDATQFARWDLNNSNNLPAASGVYIILIEMPDLGAEKVLKLALVREQQFLRHF